MKLKPLGRRVVVKLLEEDEKKTAGGIVLPQNAMSEKSLQGEVVAVADDEKVEVGNGDLVLIPRYGGTELERDRERLMIVKAADILAVIEKE